MRRLIAVGMLFLCGCGESEQDKLTQKLESHKVMYDEVAEIQKQAEANAKKKYGLDKPDHILSRLDLLKSIEEAMKSISYETSADRVKEHEMRMRNSHDKLAKVPADNKNADEINRLTTQAIEAFESYADTAAAMIRLHKSGDDQGRKQKKAEADEKKELVDSVIPKLQELLK